MSTLPTTPDTANLRTPRKFPAGEIVGAFADLGTLLPLTIGLIAFCGLQASPVLMLLGITYLGTATVYRLPIPVQPLKATAMLAIACGATARQLSAAALWMALIMLVFGATRLIERLQAITPRVFIHGLQLGLGLLMVSKGLRLIVVFPATLGQSVLTTHPQHHSLTATGFSFFTVAVLVSALVQLVLPQLPLTLGNSILATRDCAQTYFGEHAQRVTPTRLSLTIALGNLLAGFFGGIPICHGAGGLTAHYQFGARTGFATALLGSILLAGGLLGGSTAMVWIRSCPTLPLGVLLSWAGLKHGLLARPSFRRIPTALIAGSIALVGYCTENLLLAVAAGGLLLAMHYLLQRRQARRRSATQDEVSVP